MALDYPEAYMVKGNGMDGLMAFTIFLLASKSVEPRFQRKHCLQKQSDTVGQGFFSKKDAVRRPTRSTPTSQAHPVIFISLHETRTRSPKVSTHCLGLEAAALILCRRFQENVDSIAAFRL